LDLTDINATEVVDELESDLELRSNRLRMRYRQGRSFPA
jgi:hypothetical protein